MPSKKRVMSVVNPQGLNAASDEVREIIKRGFIPFPEKSNFNGSGAPGLFLEHLLGIANNKRDQPDLHGWEVKFHGGGTPITLFHKTPEPKKIMEYIVNQFGWPGKDNQTSFRHTLYGESDRGFYVFNDGANIIVRHNTVDGPVPYWSHLTLVNALVFKLRRLILVEGTVIKKPVRGVKYTGAKAFWEISTPGFISAIERGMVAIDFDARTTKGKSTTLRDHGTKFRIKVEDLPILYQNSVKIT